ncbi:myb/SANT-like DNA-binding domain-containing protein 4, partial [Saccostrea cucullata]|uniref:myb/SANT-like DNA-binding domain-containing protein 4 n=1 Tax=Saccostrea cuccullata TaxID=36930 RepID=UPI002ED62548
MAEKDIEKLLTSKEVVEKKVRTKWSPDEETRLISAVLDREDALFGDFKGTGAKSGQAKRRQGWEEVADVLNAQFTNSKRTPEECRKKYNNAKQRTKEKIDFLKKECRKTGGGQGAEVELSEAEEVLLQRQDGRPSIFGLEAGFDSDIVVLTTDKECEKSQTVA